MSLSQLSNKSRRKQYIKTIILHSQSVIQKKIYFGISACGRFRNKENVKQIESSIPLGKFGENIDVAYGVLYLTSEESKYVTGIELIIDGGILAGNQTKLE